MNRNKQQAEARRRTDAVCADNPTHANVLRELRELEARITGHAGFTPDNPKTFAFRMVHDTATDRMVINPLVVFTMLLRMFERKVGTMPAALDFLARAIGSPEASPAGLDPAEIAYARDAIRGEPLPPNREFYGVGVFGEGLSIDQDHPDAEAVLAAAQRAEDHPAVANVVYLKMVTRDARIWDLVHQEGHDPAYNTIGPDDPGAGMDGSSPSMLDALLQFMITATDDR